MGSITATFASAFRDYVTDGVPASGANDPVKSEVRAIGPIVEAALGALSLGSVSVTKDTRAHLNADLAHAVDTIALVFADSTDANNDLYVKVGASGSGSWTLTGILHTAIDGLVATAATVVIQPLVDEATAAAAAAAASEAVLSGALNDLGTPLTGATKTEVAGRSWTPVSGIDPGAALTLVIQDKIKRHGFIHTAKIMGGTTGGTVNIRQFSYDLGTDTYTQVGTDHSVTTIAGTLSTTDPAIEVFPGNYIGVQFSALGAISGTSTTADNRGYRYVSGDHASLVAPATYNNFRFEVRFESTYSETLVDRAANSERGFAVTFASTPKLLIVEDGNSLIATPNGRNPPSFYMAATLPDTPVYNFGVAGQTTQQMTTNAPTKIDPIIAGALDRIPILIAQELLADAVTNGLTSAQAVDNMVTYCLARKAAGWIVGVGCLAAAASADSPDRHHPINTELRSRFASRKNAQTPFCDFLIDYDKVDAYGAMVYPELSNYNNSTYFQTDLTHWENPGCIVAARCRRNAIRDWLMTL